jgi:type VI secretion system protein ImpA
MPSSAVLNLQALLAPIPGDNPAGESVRYAGVYDAIQESRREDDILPMGEWQREAKTADWRAVVDVAMEALTKQSKDLQIAAWLVEALVKTQGFAGLRDGLQLLRELQERFWNSIHPVIEDEDLEVRTGPLNWINGRLPVLIGEISVTARPDGYSWHRWEESRIVDNLGRQSDAALAQAIAEGKITGEQFDKAVNGTPRAFYEQLFEDIQQAWEACRALIDVVDEKFGKDAPSLMAVKKAIENCRSLVDSILKNKRALDPNYKPPVEPLAAPVERPQVANGPMISPEPIGNLPLEPTSREDAFRRLAAIAEYLKRVEPQSPVSYLVDRAVRWSKMPLGEWLVEVVQNDDVLNRLRETLGIKEKESA